MLSAIVHRGPDDTGKWHGSRVALGQQRLTILDLSTRANQPMLTPGGRSVLVYNGEVYNFRELRRELEGEGIQFRTSGDTEVVLQALHHWGPERSIPRFDGMFAFAYLDLREQALWLARDRLGIKPLVVCQIGFEFVFASEVKALLAHPRVQRRLDRRTMIEFLLGRPHRSNHTMFDGIGGLEPGSWWKFTESGIERKQYFHVLDNVNVKRLAAANRENPTDFVDTFRHTLQTSVRLHLASDVPLGAICSGGVDSSLITAYAKDLQPKIQAYVADVQGGDSEAPQAERVARHLGIAVHRVPIDRQRYLQLWPHVVWHLDSPTPRFSDPALLAVTQACRADGIKVLLTGEGSDELFGGYEWQRATFELWRRLHRPWRKLFRRQFNHDQLRLRHAPLASMPSRKDPLFRRWLMTAMDAEIELLPRRILERLASIQPPEDRAFLAQCFADLYFGLPGLLHRHDAMGMAASMEMRVPFLENDMLDFAFHLPRRAKLQREVGKWVVKMAAIQRLPSDIVHASKKGFPMPEAFSQRAERLLIGGLLKEQMEWSSGTLDEVLAMAKDDVTLRYHVTGLEIWMRIFFGQETPDQVGERLQAVAA